HGCRKLGEPPFNHGRNTRAKTLRRHHRSGKSLCATSSVVGRAAVSAANHGNAAVASSETVRGVRARVVTGDSASGHERNSFARRAADRRACLRARVGTRVAYPTFRSDARDGTADLVPRLLRGVQRLSLRFPSEVCRKNCAVGHRRAGWTITLLSGVSAHSQRLSERYSWPGSRGVCSALASGTCCVAQTHAAHQPGSKYTTRALRRCSAVLHHADFPDPA